jgi:hypothetical protein
MLKFMRKNKLSIEIINDSVRKAVGRTTQWCRVVFSVLQRLVMEISRVFVKKSFFLGNCMSIGGVE